MPAHITFSIRRNGQSKSEPITIEDVVNHVVEDKFNELTREGFIVLANGDRIIATTTVDTNEETPP